MAAFGTRSLTVCSHLIFLDCSDATSAYLFSFEKVNRVGTDVHMCVTAEWTMCPLEWACPNVDGSESVASGRDLKATLHLLTLIPGSEHHMSNTKVKQRTFFGINKIPSSFNVWSPACLENSIPNAPFCMYLSPFFRVIYRHPSLCAPSSSNPEGGHKRKFLLGSFCKGLCCGMFSLVKLAWRTTLLAPDLSFFCFLRPFKILILVTRIWLVAWSACLRWSFHFLCSL